jgi:hypothetical protein
MIFGAQPELIPWADPVVVLTRAGIEKALAGSSPRPGGSPGLIVLQLFENGVEPDALYELFLRVERAP